MLSLAQRVARKEKIRIEVDPCICGKREIADLVRGLESATKQLGGESHMLRPARDPNGEVAINHPLKALQTPTFSEFIPDLAEPKSYRMVTEARAGNATQHDIGE